MVDLLLDGGVGLQAVRGLEFLDRFRDMTGVGERDAQIQVRIGIVRLEPNGFAPILALAFYVEGVYNHTRLGF